MSRLQIQQYLNELQKLKMVSGTTRESVVREAFKDLLKGWARSHDLTFIPEHEIETKTKERRYVDGALMHTLRVPFGYWEAKDEKDDLDEEIQTKFKRGYPKTNIIFEDSKQAVLFQNSEEVMRCAVDDVEKLEQLLELFFGYERPEIEAFRKAVAQFKTDLPAVLEALRQMIDGAYAEKVEFRNSSKRSTRTSTRSTTRRPPTGSSGGSRRALRKLGPSCPVRSSGRVGWKLTFAVELPLRSMK